MKTFSVLVLTFNLTLITACASLPPNHETGKLLPAILKQPSKQVTEQLTRAISIVLKREILLAKDVFTNSNHLILETMQHPNSETKMTDGLIVVRPQSHQFSLFSDASKCILLYEKTQKHYPLQNMKCKVL